MAGERYFCGKCNEEREVVEQTQDITEQYAVWKLSCGHYEVWYVIGGTSK